MTKTRVFCGGCGEELGESPNLIESGHKPCSKCGSTIRNFESVLEERLELHDRATGNLFPPCSKRWKQRVESGKSLYRKTREWNDFSRNFNRVENQYDEVFKNKDGKVIKEVHEPLTEHRDHGSAKKTSKEGKKRDK